MDKLLCLKNTITPISSHSCVKCLTYLESSQKDASLECSRIKIGPEL